MMHFDALIPGIGNYGIIETYPEDLAGLWHRLNTRLSRQVVYHNLFHLLLLYLMETKTLNTPSRRIILGISVISIRVYRSLYNPVKSIYYSFIAECINYFRMDFFFCEKRAVFHTLDNHPVLPFSGKRKIHLFGGISVTGIRFSYIFGFAV